MKTLNEILVERGIKFEQKGSNIVMLCPYHDEKTASMSVSLSKGIFKCFGCGESGSIQKLLSQLGEEVAELEYDAYSIMKESLLHVITGQLVATKGKLPSDMKLLDFNFRGLEDSTIKDFSIFTSKDYPNRISVPLYKDKKLYAIYSRALDEETEPRWLVTQFTKTTFPFPMDKVIGSVCFVVEGLFDLFAMWECGYKNTVCALSTSNIYNTAKALRAKKFKKVYVLFDGDKAGMIGADKLEKALMGSMEVEILELPDGEDPFSMGTKLKPFIENAIKFA